jgi:lipopolysaccharide heptosyltransferase I
LHFEFFILKVLILKPSSLGDVIQALPVARLIKRHLPHSEIYWWVDAGLAPLIEGDPDLAGVIRFIRRGWSRPENLRQFVRDLRWMREQHFDWVIDLQSLARSGAVAWLANGKKLVGLDEPREGARGFYDVAVQRPSWHTHAVDWYLRTLPALDVPVTTGFNWIPEHPHVATAVREKWPVGNSRWVLLQPGARWENKRWPVENFIAVAKQLSAGDPALRFAVLGGRDDAPAGAAISAALPGRCLDLTGKTSLPEMIEWVRLGTLMITNDTGPMHVAAALRKPLVAIFGPTAPERTGPYGQLESVVRIDLPCSPCLKSRCAWEKPLACLHGVEVGRVVAAARAKLAGR